MSGKWQPFNKTKVFITWDNCGAIAILWFAYFQAGFKNAGVVKPREDFDFGSGVSGTKGLVVKLVYLLYVLV